MERHLDDPPGRPLSWRSGLTLLALALVFAFNNVDRNIFALVLPQVRADIRLSDLTVGLLTGPAFVVIYSVTAIPLSWLSDRSGRRVIIGAGFAFWSLVTIATGFANRVSHLIAARVLLGIGEATNLSPASAMIADLFGPKARALAFAMLSAAGSLGFLIAFPLIGRVAQAHGWRSVFWIMGGAGVGCSLAAFMMIKDVRRATRTQATAEVVSLGKALGLAFRSRPFMIMTFAGVMIAAAYSAMTAWIPTFMWRVHGLNARQTGEYLGLYRGAFGIVAALGGGAVTTLLCRVDGRWLVWVPGILCLLIVPADVLLLLSSSSLAWQAGLALDTLFLMAAVPCSFAIVLSLADPRMRATGSSVYFLAFNMVGQGLGPVAVGALNEAMRPMLGDAAVRYSLLFSPICLFAAAVALFALSDAFRDRGARAAEAAEEPAPPGPSLQPRAVAHAQYGAGDAGPSSSR